MNEYKIVYMEYYKEDSYHDIKTQTIVSVVLTSDVQPFILYIFK